MKKIICLVAVLAFLLAGCGAEAVIEEKTGTTVIQTEATTQTEETQEEWAVLTPPLDYEIINGLAKTPTHYYAPHEGGILRAPINDISRAERVPLPGSHEGMKLRGAEICGITQEWLFVNLWEAREKERHGPDDYGEYYEYENYENRTCVTYRIAMKGWKAEAIAAGRCERNVTPWYNAAGDSLLIVSEAGFEAMPLSTRKRIPVEGGRGPWGGWWCNTIDGRAVIRDFTFGDEDDIDDCHVYDANNQAQLTRLRDLNFPKYWDWRRREAPKNKAEEDLLSIPRGEAGCVYEYATCGKYVYYVQRDNDTREDNLYRVNTDGTERKLLRESTNIWWLQSVGGKLFCQAWHPTIKRDERSQIDMCLLDEEGKVEEVLFKYWDDTEGNIGYGMAPYGGMLMVTYDVIYGPVYFKFLYDPATGARFPAG